MYTNSRRVQCSTSERDTRNESAQLLLVPVTGATIRETSLGAHGKSELSEVGDTRNSRGIITRVTDLSVSLVKIILLCGRATGFFPASRCLRVFSVRRFPAEKGTQRDSRLPARPATGAARPSCFPVFFVSIDRNGDHWERRSFTVQRVTLFRGAVRGDPFSRKLSIQYFHATNRSRLRFYWTAFP